MKQGRKLELPTDKLSNTWKDLGAIFLEQNTHTAKGIRICDATEQRKRDSQTANYLRGI